MNHPEPIRMWIPAAILLACIVALLVAPKAKGSTINVGLAWDTSPDTNVIGYAIYDGSNVTMIGNSNTSKVVLTKGNVHTLTATARTADSESDPSLPLQVPETVTATLSIVPVELQIDYIRWSAPPGWETNGIFFLIRETYQGDPREEFDWPIITNSMTTNLTFISNPQKQHNVRYTNTITHVDSDQWIAPVHEVMNQIIP